MLTGEDEGAASNFPTASQSCVGTRGTCLIYSGSFVGLDLECQLERSNSSDISSQLADQWFDLASQ